MKLDIGCGKKWKLTQKNGFQGVDIYDFGQEYVLDVREGLPFDDSSVEEIRTEHFIEHLTYDEAIDFLNECWRVLKPEKQIHIVVPHIDHPGAFVMTHRSYYTKNTFQDLSRPDRWKVYGIRRWRAKNIVINPKKHIHAYLLPLDK